MIKFLLSVIVNIYVLQPDSFIEKLYFNLWLEIFPENVLDILKLS
jgi:hypothetical protein